MEKGKIDRRVQRTRGILSEALISLIIEKGYEEITVQNIIDRANVGRSTFYAHYRDKDDLLLGGFDFMRTVFEEHNNLIVSGKDGKNLSDVSPSLALFRHARDHHLLYKAMLGKQGSHMVLKYLHGYLTGLTGLIREHIELLMKGNKRSTVPPGIMINWLVSSFISSLTWWLDHDTPCSAEKMDAIFTQLTIPGLEAGLGFKLR